MNEHRRVTVPADLAGVRADRVLAVLTGLSRAEARNLFEGGRVTVGGTAVARSTRLAAGDIIEYPQTETAVALVAAPVPFGVALERDDVVVVDKPAGLVVHPGAGHKSGTLVNGLVHRYPELGALGAEHRWGLVHRLDRDTSGLLLVARTATSHEFLQAELRARRVGRTYLALVHRELDAATGTVDAPIGRDPARPTRMAVVPDGRPARTHYRRLAGWDDVTLIEVELETGRTHQIRIHLASIGHWIVGDGTYGRQLAHDADPGRVWLHARRLRFSTAGGEQHTVVSALPQDLTDSLRRLGEPVLGSVEL
ncbi:MAG: RluA family pseudouridine synthase [Acidimicrobiia bacterium]|nr:RluA family pseudouridine synthase [Acidimicrobiia bacterium]